MKKYDKIIKKILDMCESLDEYVRKNNLQNTQWFLDYQDKLNGISVR